MLSMHRVRARLVKNRIALANEIRGLLLEFGIVIPQEINKIMDKLAEILDSNQLSGISYQTFSDLWKEFIINDNRVKELEKRLKILAGQCDLYKRLEVIPSIGLISGTALVASIGNASCFANGRQLASWLGLVPRQNSSGGKVTLLDISKRGDVYLRSLLVQGARAVLNAKLRYTNKDNQSHKDHSKFTMWIHNLSQLCGSNKTVVAVVNKLARIIFAVLSSGNDYLENKVCH